jgi:hypothetical protein
MKETFISLETAKLAKEKGVMFSSGAYYSTKENDMAMKYNSEDSHHYPCITQSLLQRWLREVHNIHINIRHRPHSQSFSFNITGKYQEGNDGELYNAIFNKYETYEQVLEVGLLESLKLIK